MAQRVAVASPQLMARPGHTVVATTRVDRMATVIIQASRMARPVLRLVPTAVTVTQAARTGATTRAVRLAQ